MARGGPDYGASSARYTIFPVTDLGELAVRLGSPVAYDRQGNVIYTESFENGLAGWDTATSGAGAAVDVSFGRGVHGAWAGRLVGGSDANRYAEIARSFGFPVLSNLGLEFAWTIDAQLSEGIAYLELYTGALRLRWGIRYLHATGQNYVLNSAGAWQAVGSLQISPADHRLFLPAKFVCDPNTPKYVRFLAGPLSFSVTAYGPQISVNTDYPRLRVIGRCVSNAGQNAVAYFDRVIITQNEV